MHNENWRADRAARIRRFQVATAHLKAAPSFRPYLPTPPLRPASPARLLWTAGATVLLGSCEVAGPGPVRQIGFIGAVAVEEIVPVPELRSGVDNRITVFTFGSSSCTTPDDVEIIEIPHGILLTPYDLVGPPAGANACTDDLAPHRHEMVLKPEQAGPLTIFVRGLVWEDGILTEKTVSRNVTVG